MTRVQTSSQETFITPTCKPQKRSPDHTMIKIMAICTHWTHKFTALHQSKRQFTNLSLSAAGRTFQQVRVPNRHCSNLQHHVSQHPSSQMPKSIVPPTVYIPMETPTRFILLVRWSYCAKRKTSLTPLSLKSCQNPALGSSHHFCEAATAKDYN